MNKILEIRKNTYFDSVTLMSLTESIKKEAFVCNAMIAMATNMNKELLIKEKLADQSILKCTENDLLIAAFVEDNYPEEDFVKLVDEKLKGNSKKGERKEKVYTTIRNAKTEQSDCNMVVISVPGEHAFREARISIEENMNVMLFSDNISVEQEKALKEKAHEKDLLMMGPDCGTAMINGVGLCFANKVLPGNIGIAGASGTGMQEVMVLIHKYGGGISNAIGVGGRDLSEEIGGIMMLDAISMLNQDKKTKVIVIVSKRPAKMVEEKIYECMKSVKKPVVIYYATDERKVPRLENVTMVNSLLEAAVTACEISLGKKIENKTDRIKLLPGKEREGKYIRGLYCGGTLCAEAFYYIKQKSGEVYSNVSKSREYLLEDMFESKKHTLLDLGDDFFTTGRAHPMIDPTIRLARIVEECKRKDCGVVLLDFELGYGSHPDPVGATIEAIKEGKRIAGKEGRTVHFVTYVQGTEMDFQDKAAQEKLLLDEGCIVTDSNYEAVKTACRLLGMEE